MEEPVLSGEWRGGNVVLGEGSLLCRVLLRSREKGAGEDAGSSCVGAVEKSCVSITEDEFTDFCFSPGGISIIVTSYRSYSTQEYNDHKKETVDAGPC